MRLVSRRLAATSTVAISILGCAGAAPRDGSSSAAPAAVGPRLIVEACDAIERDGFARRDWPAAFAAGFDAAAKVRPDRARLATLAAEARATPAASTSREWRGRQAASFFEAAGEDAGRTDGPVFVAFASALVARVEPDDSIIFPADVEMLARGSGGAESALGILFRGVDDGIVIEDVLAGGAAEAAGLMPGETIVAIDGSPTPRPNAAIGRLLTGPNGSAVRLTVRDASGGATRDVVAKRKPLSPGRLVWGIARVPGGPADVIVPGTSGVAYVKIVSFANDTAGQLVDVLALARQGGARAVVLDLRGSKGGLLKSCQDAIDCFVSDGPMLASVGRPDAAAGGAPARASRSDGDWLGPLVVLVDGGTGSGSEMVARELKRRGRATTVGTRTDDRGRGLQMLVPLVARTAYLKLTTAKLATGDGAVPPAGGLLPDVVVPADEATRLGVSRAWIAYVRAGRTGPGPLTFDPVLRAAVEAASRSR